MPQSYKPQAANLDHEGQLSMEIDKLLSDDDEPQKDPQNQPDKTEPAEEGKDLVEQASSLL